MVLNFLLDSKDFKCTNPTDATSAVSVNYIRCHFDIKAPEWKSVKAIVAVFKSARFNITKEIVLDSNNSCFIDPAVFEHGGLIQVKLVGDKYVEDEIISTTHITRITEFTLREDIVVPTPTPTKYEAALAEVEYARDTTRAFIEDVQTRIANGEFDGEDGVGIEQISFNSDGTINVLFTDGTTKISEYSFKGPKGDKGDPGVAISNIAYGQDGTLVITLSDGTTFTSEYSMKGEKGDTGEPGATGQRGSRILHVTTQPTVTHLSSDPSVNFSLPLETVLEESKADEVLVGDVIEASYTFLSKDRVQHYFVRYIMGGNKVLLTSGVSIKGDKGDKGDPGEDAAANLLDGESTNSIRQIAAAAESDSYSLGESAAAFGINTKAIGKASHAEGVSSTASGQYAHAEGGFSSAAGHYSHTEGYQASTSAYYAHAEGVGTVAGGHSSHAEGFYTKATHKAQHVFGAYNVEDPSTEEHINRGTYIEIVGNGDEFGNRSNARTLDWSGNEKLAGGLTLGMGTADEVTLTAAQLRALLALIQA